MIASSIRQQIVINFLLLSLMKICRHNRTHDHDVPSFRSWETDSQTDSLLVYECLLWKGFSISYCLTSLHVHPEWEIEENTSRVHRATLSVIGWKSIPFPSQRHIRTHMSWVMRETCRNKKRKECHRSTAGIRNGQAISDKVCYITCMIQVAGHFTQLLHD